jgi:uncharacterized membrane protein
MKQNTFYLLAGLVGLAEIGIFWISVDIRAPFLISAAFIAGIALLYLARRKVTDRTEDERSVFITQKAALRTFEVFWVIFFAIRLGNAVLGLGAPGFPRPPPAPEGGLILSSGEHFRFAMTLGNIGIMQMVLLILMIFLYVGFRIYYARQYGDWETDEEQD